MQRLLIATSNAGKLRDFAAAAAVHGLAVETLPGIDGIEAPEETAPTFEGNARDKAIYYSRFARGEVVIADDSGLEVDALSGAPGVRSARYSTDTANRCVVATGTDLDDQKNSAAQIDRLNNELLVRNLTSIPADLRTGRYRCVLAAARDGAVLFTAGGTVEGLILTAPRGAGGFGYDPLFYLPELDKTMAQINLETKDSLSHRGLAFRSLLTKLLQSESAPRFEVK